MITRVTNLLGWCSKNNVGSIESIRGSISPVKICGRNTGDSRDSHSYGPKNSIPWDYNSCSHEVIYHYQPVFSLFKGYILITTVNLLAEHGKFQASVQVSNLADQLLTGWVMLSADCWVGSSIRAPTVSCCIMSFFEAIPCHVPKVIIKSQNINTYQYR